MTPQNERFKQYFLRKITSTEASACHCTAPGIHYFTDRQASEWKKNAEASEEIGIIEDHLENVFDDSKTPRLMVDLGCGDGRKGLDIVKLLQRHSYPLRGYVAVDINHSVAEAARDLVANNSNLPSKQCHAIRAEIEQSPQITRKHSVFQNIGKNYLLLGNTYNNFERDTISAILHNLVSDEDSLIIGVQLRTGNSPSERKEILKEYADLETDFEFILGDLLGLKRDEMRREVEYNQKEHRIEMWLGFDHPSAFMKTAGLGHCSRILATISYKPLLSDILSALEPYFEVTTHRKKNGSLAVLVCRKGKPAK